MDRLFRVAVKPAPRLSMQINPLIWAPGPGLLICGLWGEPIAKLSGYPFRLRSSHSLFSSALLPLLVTIGGAWIAFLIVRLLLNKLNHSRAMQFLVGRHYRIVIAFAIGTLCFAFLFGAVAGRPILFAIPDATITVKKDGVRQEDAARIEPASEKTEIKGRIVFRLSHSFIVLTDVRKRSLTVLPEEKVEKVEIPATAYGKH
jgi:hypothetical protein